MKIYTAKFSFIGDNEAGKSDFVRRIAGLPIRDHYVPTLGADFVIAEMKIGGGDEMHMYIWDINGCQAFSMLRLYYLHGTNVYGIIIDASNPASLEHADSWNAQMLQARKTTKGMTIGAKGMIIATKVDLVTDRAAAEKAIGEVASRLGLEAVFVSAKTGEGCDVALQKLIKLVMPDQDVSGVSIKERPPSYSNKSLVVSGSRDHISRILTCTVSLIGESHAGKSTFVRQVQDVPFSDRYVPTFMVDMSTKEVIVDDVAVHLFMNDFYGELNATFWRFDTLQRSGIVIVAVDLTAAGGLESASAWRDEVLKTKSDAIIILAGMKHDAKQDVKISDDAFFAKAKELGMQPRLLSAKTGEGCNDLLADIARAVITKSPIIPPAGSPSLS